MTDETNRTPERKPLQFDTAEPVASGAAATSLACTACGADITTSYYEVNGAIACISCRAKLRSQFTGGSGSARFAKAVGFGLAAAALGSAIYYAVLALTGYEIGLVAIVVGFLVGRAVNRGSQGRGGRAYQLLAVGLTYFAIVTTYIPMIVKEIRQNPPASVADSTRSTVGADTNTAVAASAATTPVAELQGEPSIASANAGPRAEKVSVGHLLLALAALLAIAAAAPILAGVQNIVGMLIIGFALFEAWRQNQRVELAITGPYRVGAPRDGPPSAEAAGG